MRRSTWLAAGPRLRRAIIFLLPPLAVCAFAYPSRAGVRSQAATAPAIASALSQSTGLAPSQVTSEAACPPASPGFARCDAESLVLRSNHARVHPHVHGGPTFTQVFPTERRGIPSARPAYGGGPQPSAGTPAWLQQAYDLTYLSQTGGEGDTVAIVDAYDDPTAQSDLDVFRSTYGLPPCDGCFQKAYAGGGTGVPRYDAGWATEESLDLDAVSSLCPNCNIVLVEARSNTDRDLAAAETEAVSMGADQISNSWSSPTPPTTPTNYTPAGIAVLAATGDTGYLGPSEDAYPAAIPGVTAVGGTSLAAAYGAQTARGFGESAWSLGFSGAASSGCATGEPKPTYQTDVGCPWRAYSDVSADADPYTGLNIYDNGSWEQVGGTSLATPLTAAYEAITGVNGTSPKWAYDDRSLLNDPATGSNGDCLSAILYICNAGPGYDGPTGVGSISGAVVTGAPGIGGPSFGGAYAAALSFTSSTFSGGVYPNGLDTTYYWQYGLTTSYGSQTSSVDLGAGQAPVFAPAMVSGLTPDTTYHYRLVAENPSGTTYGYDSELTTLGPPVNTALPVITGAALEGQTVSAFSGGWTPAGSAFSYVWQRSADGVNWTTAAGATGSTYTPGAADVGDELRVLVTASNPSGRSSAVSAAIGPVANGSAAAAAIAPPRWKWLPDISADPGRVGDTVKVTRGTWTGSPLLSDVIRVMRCTNTCVAVGPSNLTRYTITPADISSSLWVQETVSNAGGTAVAWSPRSVGPVASVSSAAVVLSAGQTAVRNSRGDALAIARISSSTGASARGRASRARPRVLDLRRAGGVKGKVSAWVCPVAGKLGGPPPICTARVSLGAHASIRLPASMRGAVRVVVVRRGR
jgi:hypothetical protein